MSNFTRAVRRLAEGQHPQTREQKHREQLDAIRKLVADAKGKIEKAAQANDGIGPRVLAALVEDMAAMCDCEAEYAEDFTRVWQTVARDIRQLTPIGAASQPAKD